MSDTTQSTPNPLTPALLDTIHLARQRAEELAEVRALLYAAIDAIAELHKDVDRYRASTIHLRAQIRAAVSGRTIAEERADVEREDLDALLERAA